MSAGAAGFLIGLAAGAALAFLLCAIVLAETIRRGLRKVGRRD